MPNFIQICYTWRRKKKKLPIGNRVSCSFHPDCYQVVFLYPILILCRPSSPTYLLYARMPQNLVRGLVLSLYIPSLDYLIQFQSFKFHLYVSSSQTYFSAQKLSFDLQICISNCLSDICLRHISDIQLVI